MVARVAAEENVRRDGRRARSYQRRDMASGVPRGVAEPDTTIAEVVICLIESADFARLDLVEIYDKCLTPSSLSPQVRIERVDATDYLSVWERRDVPGVIPVTMTGTTTS